MEMDFFAHKHGLLHRDMKPDNIMLKPEPLNWTPYHALITDLGLAKLVEGGITTQSGLSVGTPTYMPAEQAPGQPYDDGSAAEAIRLHCQAPLPPAAGDNNQPVKTCAPVITRNKNRPKIIDGEPGWQP